MLNLVSQLALWWGDATGSVFQHRKTSSSVQTSCIQVQDSGDEPVKGKFELIVFSEQTGIEGVFWRL